MLRRHLEFILMIILLAVGIQIKNKYFNSKPNLALSGLSTPVASSLYEGPKSDFNVNPQRPTKHLTDAQISKITQAMSAEQQTEQSQVNSIELVKITLPKMHVPSQPEIVDSDKNVFTKTYKKFANLEFIKDKNKQYLIDFKEFKQDFLSLGFTVDKGQIRSPKVTVKYTNGFSEELKIPYDQMFKNDWVKLDTKPNLTIQSLMVTAAGNSPSSKSIFSFFIQQNL